jgi:hypothetical protein
MLLARPAQPHAAPNAAPWVIALNPGRSYCTFGHLPAVDGSGLSGAIVGMAAGWIGGSDGSSLHRMKILDWNVQWCPRVSTAGSARSASIDEARGPRRARRPRPRAGGAPATSRRWKGSGGEDFSSRLNRGAPAAGFTAIPGIAVDTAAPDGSRRSFGNMILSRLPVRQATRVQLPCPSDPDVSHMPRMLLEAVVRAPFGLLRVMTTHLEYYSALQREAQVEGLRARHAEASAHARRDRAVDRSEGPFHSQAQTPSAILTGDFNAAPPTPPTRACSRPSTSGHRPSRTPGRRCIPASRTRRPSACTTASSGPSLHLRLSPAATCGAAAGDRVNVTGVDHQPCCWSSPEPQRVACVWRVT